MVTIPPCHGVWYEFESRYLGMINGKQAEEIFMSLLPQSTRATREQDMFEHWDVECEGVKYDVKTQKRLNRSDTEVSDVIWIELQNVRGEIGWLKGKADKIAILLGAQFIIVDREKLFSYIKETITNLEVQSFKEYKRWYQRRGRKDIITYLYLSDIEHLIEQKMLL